MALFRTMTKILSEAGHKCFPLMPVHQLKTEIDRSTQIRLYRSILNVLVMNTEQRLSNLFMSRLLSVSIHENLQSTLLTIELYSQ